MDLGEACELLASGYELIDKDGTFWRMSCDGEIEVAHAYGQWFEPGTDCVVPTMCPFELPDHCQQCGVPSDCYWAGLCEECSSSNDRARHDAWLRMSPRQRDAAIRDAARLA